MQDLKTHFRVVITPQATFHDGRQICIIVYKMVFYHCFGRFHQADGEAALVRTLAVAVLQCFNGRALILRFHLPDGDCPPLPAVGVGHIKNIAQAVAPSGIHQQGYSRCAFIDPAAPLVPKADFRAGRGVRLLGKNQKLVTEIVFEVVSGGSQKCHVVFATCRNLAGGFFRKLDN
ncbi:MAG: hypothetical protein HFF09_07920 [Oscillospiraceae bacterium]|nr:hypothetical protein [Oscillospiraceae bacterium]